MTEPASAALERADAASKHGPATDGVATQARFPDAVLAWYFVVMWGSGFLATKTGLRFAAPFTFLTLRFALGIACLAIWTRASPPAWPRGARTWAHVVVAGLLMHVGNLGGSHYAQYLGLSAGLVALILATQPLLTALVLARRDPIDTRGWLGIALGLAGVALVVGERIDAHAISAGSLLAAAVALVSITAGTLYQRRFCADVDLRAGGLVQFVACVVVLAPLAAAVEGFVVHWDWRLVAAIAFLVVGGSILAINALHTLMRHGNAARVTSLLYLTPVVATCLEWALFGVVPGAAAVAGIAVTCAGVALVTARRRTPVAETET